MTTKSLRLGGLALFWAMSLAAAYYIGNASSKESTPQANGQSAAGQALKPGAAGSPPKTSRAGTKPVGNVPGESTGKSPPPKGMDSILFHARTSVVKGSKNPVALRQLFRAIDQLKLGEIPAALERLSSNPIGQSAAHKRMLLTALLTRWAQLDGEGAANYIRDELTNDSAAVSALSYVLETWAQDNFAPAYRWLQAQGKSGEPFLGGVPPDSSLFLAGIFKAMASQEAAEAFDRLQDIPAAGDRQILLANMLLHTESEADRAAWLGRIDTLPEQTARDATDHLIRHLLTSDLETAASWISQMSDQAEGDRYGKMLTDQWMLTDSAAALDWASGMTPGDAREQALSDIYREWKQKNPAAAAAGIENSNLTPEEIERLRSGG